MSVLYIALPVAVLLASAALMAFIWAVRDGQLDDIDTPAMRVVNDEDVT